MAELTFNEGRDYPKGACVGPYWFVRDDSGDVRLIAQCCALADGEKYGDFLTGSDGHYDLWERWRMGNPPEGLRGVVHDAEYEEWPRGRVVFNFVQRRFTVYGDRQVFEHELQHRVLERFGVPADRVEFAKDGHYRCSRSLYPGPGRDKS
jgi:hypothetical protein